MDRKFTTPAGVILSLALAVLLWVVVGGVAFVIYKLA